MDRGEIDRLSITCPPRHGKSEQVTIRRPAFRLEHDPARRFIIGAYNQDLAKKFSRKTRGIIRQRGRICLNPEAQAVHHWETAAGGALMAAGVSVGVTGHGADEIIIDDPVKSRAEANSQAYRDGVWDWYTDDLYTRLEPDGVIIVIMCMVGGTMVRMADGSERALRDVRPGDQVATYEGGALSTATIQKWANQGPDDVFEIKTANGYSVRANARHPFMVEREGERLWVRLSELKVGDKMVRLRGEVTAGQPVSRMDATSQRDVRDGAPHTTTSGDGQQAKGHQATTHRRGGRQESSTDTESQSRNTGIFRRLRRASARFVGSLQRITSGLIGAESSASITTTKQGRLEGYFATTATYQSGMEEPRKYSKPQQNTCDFTLDRIQRIEPAGREEVFDIQVERTENFIADGFVSHNTRWHEDDLMGRILASEEADSWTLCHLPAEAEDNDELGRRPGQALCPDRYDELKLARIRRVLGQSYHALYQGRPVAQEGNIILTEWFRYYDRPENRYQMRVQSWDCANKDKELSDWNVGTTWGIAPSSYDLLDEYRDRLTYPKLRAAVKQQAEKHSPDAILIEDKGNGTALLQDLRDSTRLPVIPIEPQGDKVMRLSNESPAYESGMVRHPKAKNAPWVVDFEAELISIPNAANDDRGDSVSQFLKWAKARTKGNTVASAGRRRFR